MRQESEQPLTFMREKDIGRLFLRRWNMVVLIFFALLLALFLFSGVLFYRFVLREDGGMIPADIAPAVTVNRQNLDNIISRLETKAKLLEEYKNKKPEVTDPF